MKNGPALGDLDALERFVAENDELLELEAIMGRFNVFEALRIERAEIRHSNFLAWLLNPAASHGQGDLFLKAVVMDILRAARAQDMGVAISPVAIDGEDLDHAEVRREWNHVDLLIVSEQPSMVLAIENKVDSDEHSDQLSRYKATIAGAFPGVPAQFVFLTTDGDEASEGGWVSYSYEDLHRVLRRTRAKAGGSLGVDVGVFVDHYLNVIGTKFMEDSTIAALCRKIRANHGRALDLIWQYTGGESEPLLSEFAQRVRVELPGTEVVGETGRDVKVVPKEWLDVLPEIGEGSNAQAWLSIRFVVKQRRCYLVLRTSTVADEQKRNAILERLFDPKSALGFKPKFKSWRDQKRVLLKRVDVSAWTEEEEPDTPALTSKAIATLKSMLSELGGVAELLRGAGVA
jgi:hypothetical protein